jgi:sec-independent protein translocase protein TatB
MAEGARGQLREQMGPEFDDINWRQYDPRQYDPRRIVREALLDPDPLEASTPDLAERPSSGFDAGLPTPYDVDAT